MKVLITGSSGYLGTVALNHLISNGFDTVGLDLDNHAEEPCQADRFYRCDITDRFRLIEIFSAERPDAVIHLAGTTNRVRDRKKEYEIDIGGTANLLEASCQTPTVKKFIYSSSAAIYGPARRKELWLDETVEVNPGKYRYGLNKKMAEELILTSRVSSGLHVVALRICTVVGPLYSRPRSVVSILMRMPVLPASFRAARVQFLHEVDFTEMIRKLLEEEDIEGLFNLAPDSCTVVGDVVPAARFRRFPCSLLKPVMWLLWNLRLANLQPAGFRYCLYPVVMDPSKLAGRFGYHFRYTSSEAFLATSAQNRIPPGTRF